MQPVLELSRLVTNQKHYVRMTDPVAIAVGACIGSGITGIVAIVSSILQRRSDERRQIRELAVNRSSKPSLPQLGRNYTTT